MGYIWEASKNERVYMSKENKNCYVRVRITKSERDQIEAYCAKHDLSISEFMRLAIEEFIRKDE